MGDKQALNVLRGELEQTTTPEDRLLAILEQLDKEGVSYEIIKETKIGYAVGKLRKHLNTKIVALSNNLVNKWKKIVDASKAPSSASQEESPTQTPKAKVPVKQEATVKTESPKTEDKKRKTENDDGGKSKKVKAEKESVKEEQPKAKAKTPAKDSGDSAQNRRTKAAEMLKDSIGNSNEYALDPEDIAKEIEEELYKMFNGEVLNGKGANTYKTKLISLCFNLKNPKNPDLRGSLMTGAISVQQLCTMHPHDMAGTDLRALRDKFRAYHLEAAKLLKNNQTSTDMFKCGKCGGRETTYYQMQTRSADEPMTTFHTCQKCGHRWKS